MVSTYPGAFPTKDERKVHGEEVTSPRQITPELLAATLVNFANEQRRGDFMTYDQFRQYRSFAYQLLVNPTLFTKLKEFYELDLDNTFDFVQALLIDNTLHKLIDEFPS